MCALSLSRAIESIIAGAPHTLNKITVYALLLCIIEVKLESGAAGAAPST